MKDENVFEAIEFAAKAHRGQFRKGTKVPYLIHPLGVAKILIEHDCAEEIVIAGILHDTVEDTTVTIQEIKEQFGLRIAQIVEGLTEPDKSQSWEDRKKHTLAQLKTAPLEILLVACADKIDNIQQIQEDYARQGEAIWSRFNRPKINQKWYYQTLAGLFLSRIENETTRTLFTGFKSVVDKVFGNDE